MSTDSQSSSELFILAVVLAGLELLVPPMRVGTSFDYLRSKALTN